jgi:hypothetical protein
MINVEYAKITYAKILMRNGIDHYKFLFEHEVQHTFSPEICS